MVSSIRLKEAKLEFLTSLAKKSLPLESCALLLGKKNTDNLDEISVSDVISVKNSDSSPVSFSIDPDDLIEGYQLSESRNLHVVGIFHSHPAEPFPSSIDKSYMKINPVVWLIYSTVTNEARAYIFECRLKEVRLLVMA
ncbi:MAG: M67 family metallopeptidase [Candidatus Nitrosopolaris sp.]